MEYSYKFRIYPTRTQENLIQRTFGCCRFVYNHYLAERIAAYKERGETLNYYACSNDLPRLKQEYEWLREVNSQSLQASLRNLDTAYINFFKHGASFPKFKSKHNRRKSFTAKQGVVVGNNTVKLPKIGYVDCYISWNPNDVEIWRCMRRQPEYVLMKEYGITWRCWTHRPDEATRKAATWVKSE